MEAALLVINKRRFLERQTYVICADKLLNFYSVPERTLFSEAEISKYHCLLGVFPSEKELLAP